VNERRDELSTADLAYGTQDETAEGRSAPAGVQPETGEDTVVESRPAAMQMAPLFSSEQTSQLRDRWTDVQTGFVDEPRQAVEQADSLVAEVMQQLATTFADERGKLEQQWDRGDDISTEDLRVALQRYRSFFDRLLAV
jgi:hypothetical protein